MSGAMVQRSDHALEWSPVVQARIDGDTLIPRPGQN